MSRLFHKKIRNVSNNSLKEKTAKGLLWGGLGNGIMQILNLVFGIFLARLLTPSDYGMVGMLAIFSAIAGTIQESGFTNALANKQNITHNDYNAVFWFSTLTGGLLYIILFLSAPLIADYYNQPDLIRLSRIYFLGFVISSTATSHNAYLFRNLMTREKATAQIYAITISCLIGIILAYNGMSYWGLAIQNLIYIAIVNLSLWFYSPWRPTFNIDFGPIKEFFGFSVKILLTNIFNQVNNNIFSTIIGRKFTPYSVGLYTQANKWNSMGSSLISSTIGGVAQPIFAQATDDKAKQLSIFRKMLRFTSYISFPTMLGLALIAPEFILLTIKDKWIDCIPILQQLCIWGAFFPITTLCSYLLISRGKSNLNLYSNITLGCLQIVALLISWRFGISIMISTYVIINILWMIVWYLMVRKEIGLRFMDAIKDICPFIIITIVAAITAKVICGFMDSPYMILASKIIITAVLYLGISRIANSKIQDEIFSYLLKRKIK